jgi:hypothetical protein
MSRKAAAWGWHSDVQKSFPVSGGSPVPVAVQLYHQRNRQQQNSPTVTVCSTKATMSASTFTAMASQRRRYIRSRRGSDTASEGKADQVAEKVVACLL